MVTFRAFAALIMLFSFLAQAQMETPEDLASSAVNTLAKFTPAVSTNNSLTSPERREVPIVWATTPCGGRIEMEIPEYLWADIEGDPHNDSPFYYGRVWVDNPNLNWTKRYAKLDNAMWVRKGDALEIENGIEGGFTIYFKVIPKDRMYEVHTGIRNESGKRVSYVRHVICASTATCPVLADPSPGLSRLYADGSVISWGGAGQAVQGARFRAFLKGYEPPDFATMPKLVDGKKFYLNRLLDLPSIAKADKGGSRFLIIYSPQGREAFTNAQTPCFHTNTGSEEYRQNAAIDLINPGETKWAVHYYTFFEGNLTEYYRALAGIHERLTDPTVSIVAPYFHTQPQIATDAPAVGGKMLVITDLMGRRIGSLMSATDADIATRYSAPQWYASKDGLMARRVSFVRPIP
jgi:hypothetical protein